jgi:pimeloyl-ACP methyl ester carboxylesterase
MNVFKKMEEKYIECYEGVKLHTLFFGKGEPLILLHGFPDFWYGWKNIILELMGEYKLVVPDTRGINLSSKAKEIEAYKTDILVEDIKILSEKLNFSSFTLAGHDWGGVIAWAFGFKYPKLLKRLIILNAPHPRVFRKKIQGNTKQRRSSGYIFQLLKPGGEQSLLKNDMNGLKAAVFGTSRRKGAFTEEDKQKYIESWSQPDSILCGVNYYRANVNIEQSSGVIEVPTLVIHGMKDNFVRPTVLEGLEKYVKNLTIIKAEKSSHWVMHDEPELVASSIKDFIQK